MSAAGMNQGDPRRRLAGWRAAAADAVEPALDEAARLVAAEAGRRLGSPAAEGPVVTTGRDPGHRATVTVTVTGAAAREFGTRRTPAQPFLRPAVAALRDTIGRCLAAALREALSRGAGR